MPALQPLEVRYSRPFHLTLATLGIGLVAVAAFFALTAPPEAGVNNLRTENLMLIGACALALLYYAVRSIRMLRDPRPQVVAGPDGVRLEFGRGVLIPWQDVQWLRVKGIRPMVQLGIAPHWLAGLQLSIWNLDDYLTAIPGAPSALGIRCAGLDSTARDIHAALEAWRRAAPKQKR